MLNADLISVSLDYSAFLCTLVIDSCDNTTLFYFLYLYNTFLNSLGISSLTIILFFLFCGSCHVPTLPDEFQNHFIFIHTLPVFYEIFIRIALFLD